MPAARIELAFLPCKGNVLTDILSGLYIINVCAVLQ